MLRTRIITAVVLIAVLLAVLFVLPASLGIVAVAAAVLLGAWEWTAFIGLRSGVQRGAYLALVALVSVVAWLALMVERDLTPLLWLSLGWWVLALMWVLRYPRPISAQLVALCGIAVLVPLGLVLAALLAAPGPGGAQLLLLMLVIVWAADIGAFFAGRTLGRVKLAPRVSPGKTWEGVIGGVCAAAAAAAAGAWLLDLPVAGLVFLGIAVAGISVVGDLTVSMFKRNAGLKDSGHLIPGHGGILDRIDSLASAAPLYLLGLGWLGAAP